MSRICMLRSIRLLALTTTKYMLWLPLQITLARRFLSERLLQTASAPQRRLVTLAEYNFTASLWYSLSFHTCTHTSADLFLVL